MASEIKMQAETLQEMEIFYRMVSATIARLQKYLVFLVLKCYKFAVIDDFLEGLTQEKYTDIFK